MFELLTWLLLWGLILYILWYIFSKFINKVYLTWLGGLIVFAFLVLAFLEPTNSTVSTVWGVLSLPLKPLGLTLFLLLSALREGTKKIAANQVVAALLILFFSSMPIVAYWLLAQTERSANATVQVEGRVADPATVRAIVVLGDDTLPADPAYGSQVQMTGDGFGTSLISRLTYAGRLYREQAEQGNQPLVIVSAGPQPQLNAQEAGETQAVISQLSSLGVPTERIIVDTTGTSVRNSAIATERLLLERGFRTEVDTIILVSPTLVTRRATSAFSQLGFKVIPRPTDFFAFQMQRTGGRTLMLSDLVPNVEALSLTTRAVDEYLTSIYYFMRGWLLDPIGF